MIRSAPSSEEREVVPPAAQWLALLESGGPSEEDHAHAPALARPVRPANERAWQKAQQLQQRFFGLPTHLAM
ncbi:sugar ABC transporter substrate-binding protein, partial [Pseudomonas syringae pv. actinidifoliorum]|nr:sugar ABC transporter substrate-binding protein [Pseudomonas syringae pv. actinidifoliorum]